MEILAICCGLAVGTLSHYFERRLKIYSGVLLVTFLAGVLVGLLMEGWG